MTNLNGPPTIRITAEEIRAAYLAALNDAVNAILVSTSEDE